MDTTPKWLLISAPIALVVVIGSAVSLFWWGSSSAPVSQDPNVQPVQFQVKPGSSAQAIGQDLESQGIVKSAFAWKLWTSWLSKQGKGSLQSGTYLLSPNQSLPEIADRIFTGKVVQVGFTIKEGWNIKQMAEYLEKEKGWFPATEFLTATREIPKDKFPWLPDGIPHLEGFLYPETYKISGDGITVRGIRDQMLKQFEEKALPLYQQDGATSKLSLLEWVSLSSIVEKEAVIPAERSLIAGVFVSRLAKNMRLESDPTVEYGLGIKQTADRPLTFAEVKRPNPYNTYVNPGIPPGPIGSPGLGSLQAVLKPDPTEKLFFVAKYDGTHIFSKTLSEHVRATNEIRRQRNATKKP
jgi:UPF0755 protein